MDAPIERRVTRATNANQHPGLAGATIKKRRTKAEIEHDKALLQEKKDVLAKRKALGIARVAQLEDRMATEDSGAEDAHPRGMLFISAHGSILDMKTDHGITEAPDRDDPLSQKNRPKRAGKTQQANNKPVTQGSLKQAKEKRKRAETEDEAGRFHSQEMTSK
jgi:hypothetical protein